MAPRSSRSRGTPTRQFGVVQPGRLADRHRELDGTAKVWDAKTGAEVLTLKGPIVQVNSATSQDRSGLVNPEASFSPDGSLVVASGKGYMMVWNAQTGVEVLGLRAAGYVRASFSPDGSRIVTSSGDETARSGTP